MLMTDGCVFKSLNLCFEIRTMDGEVSGPYLSGSVHQPTPLKKAALPLFCFPSCTGFHLAPISCVVIWLLFSLPYYFLVYGFQGAWNTAYQWSLGFVSPIITWVSMGFPPLIVWVGMINTDSPVQMIYFIRQIQSTLPSSMLPTSLSSPTLPPSANPAVLTAPHHTEIAGYSLEKVPS